MRIVFVGAGELTVRTAEHLIQRGHQVVIIEQDESVIDSLTEKLDCSFLQGDGSEPSILREVGPEQTDVLFNLTNEDQSNILASLVGRTLGFRRQITSIQNTDYLETCRELGLEDIIVPSRTISRYLADMVGGVDVLELSTIIKDTARFFTFYAGGDDAGPVGDLDLPEGAKVVCYYRDGQFALADEETALREEDEVVVLTHSDNLPELRERWHPQQAVDNGDGSGSEKCECGGEDGGE
jgi:trk system potassium uptake protein TrkA